MNKPTKSQLSNAVVHYQTALDALIAGPFLDAEDLFEEVKKIRASQPSLEPQVRVTVQSSVDGTEEAECRVQADVATETVQ